MYIYRGKFDWTEYAKDEAITIIFPTSFHHGDLAYVCWQWTRSPEGKPNANFIDTATVDSKTTPSESEFTLSFPDYKFDVNLTHDFKSLSLVVHHHDDQGSMNLTVVYDSLPTETSAPSVYAGKMNWSDAMVSSANEMFLVVIPESFTTEKPLCAFWQWCKRNDEDTKVNVDCLVQIQSTPDSDADIFTFADSYRFGAYLGDGGKTLALTMKSGDGKFCRTTDLVLLTLRARTCSIRNNLPNSEVVVCTLRESGTGTIDKILAGVGVLAAVVGLVTVPASTTVGAFVAAASAGLAVAGAAHTFTDPPDAIRAALFPNESIERQHRAAGGNDVEVLRGEIKVDNGRKFLIISLSRKEQVESAALELSDVLTDSELQVWDLLWLELSTTVNHTLKSFRELKFLSIGLVDGGGADIFDDSAIPGGLFSVNPSAPNTKQLYHGRLSPSSQPSDLFKYQANSFIAVGQSDTDGGGVENGVTRYTILTLSDHKLVLKLLNYFIDDVVYVAICDNDEQVKTMIQTEEASGSSAYVAYYFDFYDKKLYGAAKGRTSWKVKQSTGQGESVFLVAASGPLVYRKILTSTQ